LSYKIFESHASEYDGWYDTEAGKAIFNMEVDCLKPLLYRFSQPYLEVGIGSGRFTQALGIGHGVEPAPSPSSHGKSPGSQSY